MKTRNGKNEIRTLTLAVQAALLAMCAMPAHAQDEAAASLRAPARVVEVGGLYVNQDSAKFGEYTGLNQKGGYAIGNADVRGGSAYGPGDGTTRWQIWGSDLGLTSRAAGANFADQGRWNIGLVYDELVHNTSDSYQTPYNGTMGGNSWTLSGFLLPAAGSTRALSAAQLAQFHNVNISNERQNLGLTAGLILDPRWSVKADYNRLDQSGAKLMGFGSAQFAVANNPTGERIAILPMPQNYTTDTATVALNYLGEKGHATVSYFGSYFHNKYNGVNFDTFVGANVTETMGTPPSNTLHQLNLTGGYALSQRTRFAGGASYSYNTQNTDYAYDTAAMVTPSPTNSLNGSVRTSHLDLKLTDQTTRDLALSGGLKYDYRNNRTASNIYNFRAIDGGNIANYPNAPLDIKKWQAELAGDYRLSARQKVRLAYNHEDTHRYCEQYASGGGTPAYAPGTNCVTVFHTKEDKIGTTYRVRAADSLNLNAGYTYGRRRSDRDELARTPMIGRDGNPTPAGVQNIGGVGITGLNAGEMIGFNPFFEASRRQHLVKAGVNWEATEQLSFGTSARYTADFYDTQFGMQRGKSWGLNLDSTYAYRENGSFVAYWTRQQRTRYMTNEARSPFNSISTTVPNGGTWNNDLTDSDTTVGLGFKQGGLMSGKLEFTGDTTYTWTKTTFSTTLNYNLLSGAPCSDPTVFTCVPAPDITSSLFQVRLAGTYALTRSSKVQLGVLHQRLKSDDFYYNGLQNGFTPTGLLPSNQTAPNYSLNVVYASYLYSF
jgi:MtrB/PioB family decaheme-associated outer membrane protein